MKAITLWQPWATLIAVGAKTIETRSWDTPHRGQLAIHAGSRMPRPGEWPHGLGTRLHELGVNWTDMPRGCVVAVARLVETCPTEEVAFGPGLFDRSQRLYGDVQPGRFAWILDRVEHLKTPIKIAGSRRLWELQDGAFRGHPTHPGPLPRRPPSVEPLDYDRKSR